MYTFPLLYLYRFFGEFVPIVPLLGVFFLNGGLSISEISMLFFILAASVFIFEIPTGLLADRMNAKVALSLSRGLKFFAFGILFFSTTIWGFSLAVFLWGISSALDSGAFQSYLFTLTREYSKSHLFEKIYGRAMTASMLGLLLSAVLITQMEHFHFQGLQILGLLSLFLSFICLLLLPNVVPARDSASPVSALLLFPHALRYVFGVPLLMSIALIGIFAGGIKGALDDYSTILLMEKGLTIASIGYVLFGLEIVKSSGGLLAQWIKISDRQQPFLLSCIGLCLLGAGYFGSVWLVIGSLAVLLFADSLLWIYNDASIQRKANDSNRATLASFKNFGTECVAMMVFLLVWILGTGTFTAESIYIYGGAALVVAGFLSALVVSTQKRGQQEVT